MASFEYHLPPAAIAQEPAEPRTAARLLVATEPTGPVDHRRVADLPELLAPGDVVVVNDTRVLPARLRLRKATGARIEVLLLEPTGDGEWEGLVRPGRRAPPGTVLLHGTVAVAEVGPPAPMHGGCVWGRDGRRVVRILDPKLADEIGEVALPPYIDRPLADPERYQTVYARRPGSVAAPTAGLHLTTGLLDAVRAAGAQVASVDLAVGLDTFRPMTGDRPQDHVMHSEAYIVPVATWAACQAARRVLAVGTTTVRALESAAATGKLEGRTSLFIRGSHPWRVVDLLLTNFHLPRSSLLVMVEAFYGPGWRNLYDLALAEGYRFLSFGDAMLLARRANGQLER
ncbi:MAG: tRNA preQ1(34) S-adenosylmethionine ribosyltransferase-isomerase QueA [Acidimicrobiales bacterium]|nr:MAG: tRNA preQ1(34) S-adenosylmethionine ribosyltransferase-isomerase QueA [Acidimicrobiales bacterium]